MKVEVPIEFNVKCRSNCANCKWGQKPSSCEPWNEALINFRHNINAVNGCYNIIKAIDKIYGVENKAVEDN